MSEKMTEPKNIPHNWDYQSEFHTVTCGGCSFRYGAEHPDSDGWWTCPNCGNGNNPARASSLAQEPIITEPIAQLREIVGAVLFANWSGEEDEPGTTPWKDWTDNLPMNSVGLGKTHFLETADQLLASLPSEMLAIPAPPQPGRQDGELEELVAQAIWEECCPGMKWGQIDHLIYCRMAGAAIARMRALTGEPK